MKTLLAAAIILGFAVFAPQATTPPLSLAVSAATHASCPATISGTTQYCFAADGAWESLSGAAYVQLGAVSSGGVTSITVCGIGGANCGTPQSGAITLDVPKTVTLTGTLN